MRRVLHPLAGCRREISGTKVGSVPRSATGSDVIVRTGPTLRPDGRGAAPCRSLRPMPPSRGPRRHSAVNHCRVASTGGRRAHDVLAPDFPHPSRRRRDLLRNRRRPASRVGRPSASSAGSVETLARITPSRSRRDRRAAARQSPVRKGALPHTKSRTPSLPVAGSTACARLTLAARGRWISPHPGPEPS